MLLKTAAKYLKLTWILFSHGLMSALEYRASFITQVLGMIFNNICWVICWWIYFQKFPSIQGWQFNDSMVLFALGCFSFGLFGTFFAGAFELSRTIYRGELDYYLTFPKNVLWHVSMSKMYFSGIGDIIYGIIGFIVFADFSIERFALFIVGGFISAIAVLSFVVITQSVSFFVGNFEDAAANMLWSLITFCIYPLTSFYGGLKVIICTLVPAVFIYGVPHSMIQNLSLTDLLYSVLYMVSIFTIAVWFFYYGLRRYESGSLIQAKT